MVLLLVLLIPYNDTLNVEIEFDEEEEGEMEDEEGIKFLAELLLSGYRYAKDSYSDCSVYVRVWLAECFGAKRKMPVHCVRTGSTAFGAIT